MDNTTKRHITLTMAGAAALATVAIAPAPTAASSALGGLQLELVTERWATTDLAWRADDAATYLVEQHGRIFQLAEGEADGPVVLDITGDVRSEYEMGLLGLVFAPDGQRAYVNYVAPEPLRTVVEEFPVADDGTFDLAGRRVVIEIDQPETNHNGGDLEFGPDGMLYIGMGDGGDFGDPNRTAQDPTSLLGKLLRIDPTPSGDAGYTVPSDNPFVDDATTLPEIWSIGLRNPWRFDFDELTGDLWIADVGEGAAEEVNAVPAVDGVDAGRGLNFGWSAFEGDDGFNGGLDEADHTPPIFTYGHESERCSISGGVVARGDGAGALDGWYVFGDFCSSELWALQPAGDGDGIEPGEVVDLPVTGANVVAVTAAPDGTVYVISQSRVDRVTS